MDERMITRLKEKDEEAWSVFLKEYHELFVRAVRSSYRSLFSRRVSPAEQDEAVGESKSRFYETFQRCFVEFQGEARFRAFVFRCVRHAVLEWRRRNSDPRVKGCVEAIAVVPAKSLRNDGRVDALHECILALEGRYRLVVSLYFFSGNRETLQGIASHLGASLSAVQKRYQRALQRLFDCIERLQDRRGS